MINLRAYYELCKPNVVLTMLVTALVVSLLARRVGYFPLGEYEGDVSIDG